MFRYSVFCFRRDTWHSTLRVGSYKSYSVSGERRGLLEFVIVANPLENSVRALSI